MDTDHAATNLAFHVTRYAVNNIIIAVYYCRPDEYRTNSEWKGIYFTMLISLGNTNNCL